MTLPAKAERLSSRDKWIISAAILVVGAGCYLMLEAQRDAEQSIADSPIDVDSLIAASIEWELSVDTSAMDDSPSLQLTRLADFAFTAWPQKRHWPELTISCSERTTRLYIHNGTASQPELGRHGQATVRLRVDEGTAFSELWTASTADDALFAPNAIRLARQLAKGAKLTYEFTPHRSNPATVTFTLTGLTAQLPEVAEACGWKL